MVTYISTRYFVILVKDKDYARKVYDLVEVFLSEKLKLKLNPKSRYYPSRYGCNFCGFVIYEDYVLLRKSNKNRFKKSVKRWNYLNDIGYLDKDSFKRSIASFKGHMSCANSYRFIDKWFNNK